MCVCMCVCVCVFMSDNLECVFRVHIEKDVSKYMYHIHAHCTLLTGLPMMLTVVVVVASLVPLLSVPLHKYSPASLNSNSLGKLSLKGVQLEMGLDSTTLPLCTHSSWLNVTGLLQVRNGTNVFDYISERLPPHTCTCTRDQFTLSVLAEELCLRAKSNSMWDANAAI